MSENTLVAKIKADTDAQVAEIQATNKVEVAAIEQETADKLSALKEAHEVAVKKQHDQLELVAISRAKQSGKIASQQAKRNQINSIFAEVKADLIAQSSDTYVAYFAKQVVVSVPKDIVVTSVLAPANREAETKQILEQCGITGVVTANAGIKAGLLIKTAEGVYDITLDRLINEQQAELEMEMVAKVMA